MTRGDQSPAVLIARKPDEFTDILKNAGLEVLNLPLIATEPLTDPGTLEEKLLIIDSYDGVFLTSPAAAKVFVGAIERIGRDFAGKIYALGERVQACFAGTDLNVVSREDANTAEELVRSFEAGEFSGKRFLFLRGNRSMRTVPELLNGKAVVDEVEVYRTVNCNVPDTARELIAEHITSGAIGWVCFFSPSAVERFIELFRPLPASFSVAAIGTTTAQAARNARLNVEFISDKTSAKDFGLSLVEYLKN